MSDLHNYADCGDGPVGCNAPANCGVPANCFMCIDNAPILRERPSRLDLLKLLEKEPRHARRPISICQSNCSHCYAGHCGTSVN